MTVPQPLRKSGCFSSSSRTRARARERVPSDRRSGVRFLRPYRIRQLNTSVSSERQKAEQTCWAAEQRESVVRSEKCEKVKQPPATGFFSPTPLEDSRLRNVPARPWQCLGAGQGRSTAGIDPTSLVTMA